MDTGAAAAGIDVPQPISDQTQKTFNQRGKVNIAFQPGVKLL